MHKSPSQQTLGLLKQANEILIVGPARWSPDTASAILALHSVLKASGKNSIAVAPDPLPQQLHFLPNADAISPRLGNGDDFVISIPTKDIQIKNVHATEHDGMVDLVLHTTGAVNPKDLLFRNHVERFDAIVVIGADGLEECGNVFIENPKLFSDTPIINISVSPTNEFFGRVNFVDASASSICELLTDMILQDPAWEKHVNVDIATTLLSGIVAATESFLASNTSARSLELAADLQSREAQQSDIIEHLFKQKSFANLRVLGRLLGNLQLDLLHRLTWTHLSASDFELTETEFCDIDGWTGQLLRHMNESDIMVSFFEKDDDTLIQVRTGNEISLDSLTETFEDPIKNVDYGFDVIVKNKSVPEIQSQILNRIATWQETRLHLEKTPIKKVTIEELAAQAKPQNPQPTLLPNTPEMQEIKNVPFEIPIKTEE